jgi:hypothetical protein
MIPSPRFQVRDFQVRDFQVRDFQVRDSVCIYAQACDMLCQDIVGMVWIAIGTDKKNGICIGRALG